MRLPNWTVVCWGEAKQEIREIVTGALDRAGGQSSGCSIACERKGST